jgi:nicotinamidase-related amidase
MSAMHDAGYEIYMVADASGGTSQAAHDYSMQRMIQAGVVPMTWQQVLLEWQRDWKNRDTYDAVMALVKEHSGAYGMGGSLLCLPIISNQITTVKAQVTGASFNPPHFDRKL